MATMTDVYDGLELEGFEDAGFYFDQHGWDQTLRSWLMFKPGAYRAGWGRYLSTVGTDDSSKGR